MRIRQNTYESLESVFISLILTYFILLLIEIIWPTFVSRFIKQEIFLIIVILVGIFFIGLKNKSKLKKDNHHMIDYSICLLIIVASFFIIKSQTNQLGNLSWIINIFTLTLVASFSAIIIQNSKTKKLSNSRVTIQIFTSALLFSILGITIFYSLSLWQSIKIIFGTILITFIPGYIWTVVLFDNKELIEKIVLSLSISLVCIPIIVFSTSAVGLPTSFLSTIIISLIVSTLGLWAKYHQKNNRDKWNTVVLKYLKHEKK